MPFFLVRQMIETGAGVKKFKSRKQAIDELRVVGKKNGWII